MMARARQLSGALKRRVGTPSYRAQRRVVALMFDVMGRLLEAASHADPVLRAELAGFAEGTTIGFAVLGESLTMCVRVHERRLVRVAESRRPDFQVVFKHVSHAFWVVTFQESTALAFAHERAISQGDSALGMRFVRCLNRMQALALPELVAARALKLPLPPLSRRERLVLTGKLYARLTRSLVARKAA
jgi:hypothetical protein